MRGASHRRGETQKERLSREMDVSLRTAISLHSRKFDHSEETSFPLFLSFAIRKGVVNDDAEIFGSHRWVRSKFYLGGGIVGWIGKFFFPFLLSSLGISWFIGLNLILCTGDWLKVWDRWLSRRGDVHKSSGPWVHVYDFDTISINRVWEIYIYRTDGFRCWWNKTEEREILFSRM